MDAALGGDVQLSPDGSILYASDVSKAVVYSYLIDEKGIPQHREPFVYLQTESSDQKFEGRGMTVDREGRLYVATTLGIQVCDPVGRVRCILPLPHKYEQPPHGQAHEVFFGGENFDVLYARSESRLYRRKVKTKGLRPGEGRVPQTKPRL